MSILIRSFINCTNQIFFLSFFVVYLHLASASNVLLSLGDDVLNVPPHQSPRRNGGVGRALGDEFVALGSEDAQHMCGSLTNPSQ